MRRRDFIVVSVLGSTLAGHAQQRPPLVGFLNSAAVGDSLHFVHAFEAGLNETGFSNGRNVAVEYRWAEGQYDRLPDLAADLVQKGAAVLVASGGSPAGLAAKAVTSTTPIVFIGTNPVGLGLATSYNRPGGNVTGVDLFSTSLGPEAFRIPPRGGAGGQDSWSARQS